MMILQSLRNIVKIPELRTKILWTAFFLIIYRIGSHIPIPGINLAELSRLLESNNMVGGKALGGALVLLSTLSGGALSNCAIFSLGIMPYISASIIFSLLVKVIPSLEALSKEGASGQKKINEYTRYATVPLCLIQSIMIVKLFASKNIGFSLIDPRAGFMFYFIAIVSLTSGTIFLMWLGEQISEYGIGNGISLLIMAGIIARVHVQVGIILQTEQGDQLRKFFILIFLLCLVVAGVVYMTRGQRRIAVQQAKHTRGRKVYGGQRHFLPLKINQAGVMPVIFASSVIVFPMTIIAMTGSKFSLSARSFWYLVIYISMIYFFSYFWTSLMFQPNEMANNLKEYGSFIPGTRPGKRTADYLEKVMVHVTFVGAAFLALIALFPQLIIVSMRLEGYASVFAYNLGGTSILIVVGVVLEIIRKLESHLLMRHYDGFIKK